MSRTVLILAIAFTLLLPGLASARWIDDIVKMDVEATGPVNFSHYNHLETLGKKCTLCHNKVYNIVRSKNPDFSMDEMRKGKACGACHNGDKAFAVDDDCSACHPTHDIAFKTEVGNVTFPHDVHTEMYSCSDCHSDLFIPDQKKNKQFTMAEMDEGEACGACHDGDTAFSVKEDCASCHPTKDITFKVEDGDATFPHSTHIEMYGCTDCHSDLFIADQKKNKRFTMDEMGEGEACGACHDGDTAFTVEDNCDSCHDM
ncbi:MAG: cytochrome c3 family protein [Geopsychrobacter sp.]|nr:cytochrome c3 family protein [Geopsychrobacter sp.]